MGESATKVYALDHEFNLQLFSLQAATLTTEKAGQSSLCPFMLLLFSPYSPSSKIVLPDKSGEQRQTLGLSELNISSKVITK